MRAVSQTRRGSFVTAACFLFILGLAGDGSAQTPSVYDDFNGPTVEAKLWNLLSTNGISFVPGGMQLQAVANQFDIDLETTNIFRGDFELVVHFNSYSTTATTAWAGFGFDVNSVDGKNDESITIDFCGYNRQTVLYRKVTVGVWKNGKPAGSAEKGSLSYVAGALKIARKGTNVSAYHKAASASASWNLIGTWPMTLGQDVNLKLHAEATSTGQVTVVIDRLTHLGTRLQGPYRYGKGCAGLVHWGHSAPFLGNNNFALVMSGGAQYAFQPYVLILGRQRLNQGLGPGMPGCSLYASQDVILVGNRLGQEGSGGLLLPVPNDPALRGAVFRSQTVSVTSKTPPVLGFSNGVEAKVP